MLPEFASARAGAPPPPCPLPAVGLASRPAPAWLDETRLNVTLLDIGRPAPEVAQGMDQGETFGAARTEAGRPGWLQDLAAARTANPPMAVLSASLRGPLIPIIGFAQLMQKDLPARHRSQAYAAEIEGAATGLLATLDALLAQANGHVLPAETEPQAVEAAGDILWALRALLENAPHR